MSETTGSKRYDFGNLYQDAKRFVVRPIRSDFQQEHATEEERHQ